MEPRVVVAMDQFAAIHEAVELVDSLCGHVAGFKIGLPLVLRHGVQAARRLSLLCPGALWVADFKLADIGAIMVQVASTVVDAVDAVIAHSFVGEKGALDELKAYLDEHEKKLVLVVAMSHPGSADVYDKALDAVNAVVERIRPWGLVAPATRPHVVRSVRSRHPWAVILSPGVGAQGAEPGAALCSGADYEIVGRSITRAASPLEALREIAAKQEEALRRCKPGATG